MKLLVIGVDGLDLNLINHFNMPFIQGLVRERTVVPLKEDLWSRGWVKVLSGLPSTATCAFYEQPCLNGSFAFTQAFGTQHYPTDKEKQPLWETLNRMGVRSGFFNLPTTMPAPPINGFVVSGAGGGLSPSERIPVNACHPASIQEELVRRRTIWENRFIVSGIRTADLFINRCIEAMWRRAEVFCDLVSSNAPIDFGFLVQKESVAVSNIFMFDIQNQIDGKPEWSSIHFLVRQFFESLDDATKLAVERLQPEHIAVVSDHGAAPYRRSLNFNAMLGDMGFLEFKKTAARSGLRQNLRPALDKTGSFLARAFFSSAFESRNEEVSSIPSDQSTTNEGIRTFLRSRNLSK